MEAMTREMTMEREERMVRDTRTKRMAPGASINRCAWMLTRLAFRASVRCAEEDEDGNIDGPFYE